MIDTTVLPPAPAGFTWMMCHEAEEALALPVDGTGVRKLRHSGLVRVHLVPLGAQNPRDSSGRTEFHSVRLLIPDGTEARRAIVDKLNAAWQE